MKKDLSSAAQAGRQANTQAVTSRRNFLKQTSVTLTAAAAGSGLAPLLEGPGSTAQAQQVAPLDGARRAREANGRRQKAAQLYAKQPLPRHLTNGDDEAYATKFASFTKTFPHNELGEVDLAAYKTYLQALQSGKSEDFEKIPAGNYAAKLVNPQAGLCFDMEGADIHSFETTPPPRFDSEALAGEMNELYWRALTRDVPYSQYESNPLVNAALEDLRNFDNYKGLTHSTLFRSGMLGDNGGFFVSQFLLKPYQFGTTPIEQKYRTPVPGEDYMTRYRKWLEIQNGFPPTRALTYDGTRRFIRNGRDLSEYVHNDFSYQAFLVAGLILSSIANTSGTRVLDDANPYKNAVRQAGFATFGGPHIMDMIGRIAALALKAAWFQKWYVHRRIRPEEFAARVHHKMNNDANYPVNEKILHAASLPQLFSKNGSYLLPMAYPEGCPVHPALPGGHAAIAGACVTVLKAYFNENYVIPNPVVPNDDGTALVPYRGELTVGAELNKLASNIAYGRDTAGMHWRSDEVEGLKLGEALAIGVLAGFNGCFNENFEGYTLTKFDGQTIRINGQPNAIAHGTRAA